MKHDIDQDQFESLLVDIRELTETNCHGEALERVAAFLNDKQLVKAFEAINTLHLTVGYLSEPISELRNFFYAMMLERIRMKHGEEARKAVYDCL